MAPLLDLTKEHTAKVLALGYRLATVEHSTLPKPTRGLLPQTIERRLPATLRITPAHRAPIHRRYQHQSSSTELCEQHRLVVNPYFEDFVGVVSNFERRPF